MVGSSNPVRPSHSRSLFGGQRTRRKQFRCRSHSNRYGIIFRIRAIYLINASDVRFKGNGLESIEVQDNGVGIASENYETVGKSPSSCGAAVSC